MQRNPEGLELCAVMQIAWSVVDSSWVDFLGLRSDYFNAHL